MPCRLTYALITSARNEETTIAGTAECVISQTQLPVRWIIVSDGSTDKTDDIVRRYESRYQWIRLLRMPEHTGRDFAAKVRCFNAAYREINNDSYDVIGNLDADVTFDRDYFRFLLTKFCNEPSLGVAGTPFVEASQRSYDYRFTSINHVSGACQLFRKECFNSIGGYSEIREGGIDWVAVTSARLKGW